ncbi:ORF88 [Ostreid herpesvirus 1]|nr:ORF88 [Ostreid herpesvirus 1]
MIIMKSIILLLAWFLTKTQANMLTESLYLSEYEGSVVLNIIDKNLNSISTLSIFNDSTKLQEVRYVASVCSLRSGSFKITCNVITYGTYHVRMFLSGLNMSAFDLYRLRYVYVGLRDAINYNPKYAEAVMAPFALIGNNNIVTIKLIKDGDNITVGCGFGNVDLSTVNTHASKIGRNINPRFMVGVYTNDSNKLIEDDIYSRYTDSESAGVMRKCNLNEVKTTPQEDCIQPFCTKGTVYGNNLVYGSRLRCFSRTRCSQRSRTVPQSVPWYIPSGFTGKQFMYLDNRLGYLLGLDLTTAIFKYTPIVVGHIVSEYLTGIMNYKRLSVRKGPNIDMRGIIGGEIKMILIRNYRKMLDMSGFTPLPANGCYVTVIKFIGDKRVFNRVWTPSNNTDDGEEHVFVFHQKRSSNIRDYTLRIFPDSGMDTEGSKYTMNTITDVGCSRETHHKSVYPATIKKAIKRFCVDQPNISCEYVKDIDRVDINPCGCKQRANRCGERYSNNTLKATIEFEVPKIYDTPYTCEFLGYKSVNSLTFDSPPPPPTTTQAPPPPPTTTQAPPPPPTTTQAPPPPIVINTTAAPLAPITNATLPPSDVITPEAVNLTDDTPVVNEPVNSTFINDTDVLDDSPTTSAPQAPGIVGIIVNKITTTPAPSIGRAPIPPPDVPVEPPRSIPTTNAPSPEEDTVVLSKSDIMRRFLIRLKTRDGETVDIYTWPELNLAPFKTLSYAGIGVVSFALLFTILVVCLIKFSI